MNLHRSVPTTPPRGRTLAAVALAVVCLFPFAYLLVLSVGEQWTFPALWPPTWRPERWVRVLTGTGALGPSLLLSLGISLTVAIVATTAGFVTGKFIAYHPRRRTLLFLAYVPFTMSPIILGTCLMYLFLRAHLVGSAVGVIAAQTMFAYGFSIIFFTSFWTKRVRALENVVRTLGGTAREAYGRVLVPLATEMVLICFFQTFLISWFEYGLTLLVGAGKVQTLPLQVYAYINEANIYFAAVAGCLLVVPPVALLWANKRLVLSDARLHA